MVVFALLFFIFSFLFFFLTEQREKITYRGGQIKGGPYEVGYKHVPPRWIDRLPLGYLI